MVAIFWIALSALHLITGGGRLIGARVLRNMGNGWYGDQPWGWAVGGIVPSILSVVGLLSIVLAVLGFIVGFGLLEHQSWARSLAIVVAVIALLNPILGTLLGIYTLWVLMPSDAEAESRGMGRTSPS